MILAKSPVLYNLLNPGAEKVSGYRDVAAKSIKGYLDRTLTGVSPDSGVRATPTARPDRAVYVRKASRLR